MRNRKRIFKETGGGTGEWKEAKKNVKQVIDRRCKNFQENQKKILLADDGGRSFFKQTKN